MKIGLLLGKCFFALIWLVLLINLISPFPGKAATILYILTATTVIGHAAQLFIFRLAFGKQHPLNLKDICLVMVFGSLGLTHLKSKLNTDSETGSQAL